MVFHDLSTAKTCYSYRKGLCTAAVKVSAKLFFFFFFLRKIKAYLLVWKCRLDHGSFKTVRPLELCLLPQGLKDLYRITLYGQRFCKQALKKMLKTGFQAFLTWPLTKSILFLQWDSHANNHRLVHFSVRSYDGSICTQLDKSSNISLGFFLLYITRL